MYNESCSSSSCLSPTTGAAPQAFASALQFFAAAQCAFDIPIIPDSDVCDGEMFDFIIIGAGAAGCVLANRLSEIHKWKILLLEAGGDAPIESYIPGFSKNFYRTAYDWDYYSIDNKRISQGIINGRTYLPRGKMFGGSTGINGMFYIRAHKQDLQHWKDEGNEDWDPEELMYYYKKLESLQNEKLMQNETIREFYGHNGPVPVNQFNNTNAELTDNIKASFEEMGVPKVLDLNTNDQGSGSTTVTASNGRRRSAALSYLTPEVINRPNLKILKYALARKILINSRTKTAVGVKVGHNGCIKRYYASREVILSAGAINSPQLLLLSGVGPRKHLVSKNIKCILDAPAVGQNMEDHITVNLPIFADYLGEKNVADDHYQAIQYLYNQTGSLAQGAFSDVLTFFPGPDNTTYPNFEVLVSLYRKNSSTVRSSLDAQYKYKQSVLDSFVNPNKNHTLLVLNVIFLHPKSRGSVFLNSKDPTDKPLFDSNFFNVTEDLTRLARGMQKVAGIVNTTWFRNIGAYLGRIDWPECNVYELNSLDYWKCTCLNIAVTNYHNVGTTRMGPDPKTSVVRSDLRVHGVKNCRVVDAGVMPYQISGNPMSTTYMIAEKGSDMIKQCYGESVSNNA